ncbi:helix-turn-helix domain-containing protein [Achromobacter xylosoxidans]
MDVKTAARVLDVLNLFAEAQKPLLYSEIAAQMEIPLSSCQACSRPWWRAAISTRSARNTAITRRRS